MILKTVPSQAYLGAEIHERLSWKPRITSVAAKAGRTLGFLRRNLGKCPMRLKQQAYFSLVRSQLEYASVIWDPFRQNQIYQLEKIQRKERYDSYAELYEREASVTAMRESLGIPTLEERRKNGRLTVF